MRSGLRLASYNLHRCVGADGRRDEQRVSQVLRELDADVYALQELDVAAAAEGGRRGQLERLAASLGLVAVHEHEARDPSRASGNGLLLRGTPARIERLALPQTPGREPRNAILVELEHAGTRLRVVCTHLGLWAGERARQLRRLLEWLPVHPRVPLVVMGDFNEWIPRSGRLGWLVTRFGRSRAVRSWPARYPLFALDRIWVEPGELLERLEAHSSAAARVASDHLPVWARLSWPPR